MSYSLQATYTFYYDESEHSRKINKNTIEDGNFSNSFVGMIIGFNDQSKFKIERKFDAFKLKHKTRLSNNEFKSKSFKLKYGFASVNKQNSVFLSDYLSLIDNDILIYFAVINKIEYIVNQLQFGNETPSLSEFYRMNYTLSKAVSLYRPNNVIEAIEQEGDVLSQLRIFLQKRIEDNYSNLELKHREIASFSTVLDMLNTYEKNIDFDWNYLISFTGFEKYLNERNIQNYKLILDKEGENGQDSKTLLAAKKAKLNTVTEDDSKNHIGLQIADLMAGIISKFIKSIEKDMQYKNEGEFTKRKLLSEHWFTINEDSLKQYKKLYNVISQLNNSWYKSYVGTYADNVLQFISLLEYFNHYETIGEYTKKKVSEHREHYNSVAVTNLQNYYHRFTIENGVSFIESDEDVYYNQRGAKCYRDWQQHEFLSIPQNNKKGKVYNVLSVGFFGKLEQANITIEIDEEAECFLLPNDLKDWVSTCVGLSMMGYSILPSKVEFGFRNGKHYAEISFS